MVSVAECGVRTHNVVGLCIAESLQLFCCGSSPLTCIALQNDVLVLVRKFGSPGIQLCSGNVNGPRIGTQCFDFRVGTNVDQHGTLLQKLLGFIRRDPQRRALGLPSGNRDQQSDTPQHVLDPLLHFLPSGNIVLRPGYNPGETCVDILLRSPEVTVHALVVANVCSTFVIRVSENTGNPSRLPLGSQRNRWVLVCYLGL